MKIYYQNLTTLECRIHFTFRYRQTEMIIIGYTFKGLDLAFLQPIWGTLIVIREKNSELQMCIDYRMLNNNNYLDRYPMQQINDFVDYLDSATAFSKIDLANDYH